jgi:choline monooxygenase
LSAWRIVFEQDLTAVEQMQLGRASPGYDGGVFSPSMDTATHHFHAWVAARLTERLRNATTDDHQTPACSFTSPRPSDI